MGAVKKFGRLEVVNQLRHVQREIQYPKNVDIDKSRTHLNYSLTPKRNLTEYEYLKERLSQLHIFNRPDLKIMSGWIITKPVDLGDEWEDLFFSACYNFLKDRYGGEKNVISATVHKDESGEPHLHFCFVPVAINRPNANMMKVINYFKENPDSNNTEAAKKLGVDRKTVRRYKEVKEEDIKTEKLCAREVLDKQELQNFHKDLQNYLDELGIPASVNTGITKANGGNMTVKQLKMQREHLRQHPEQLNISHKEKV